MPATMLTARNEICALVKAALDGASEQPSVVLWPDVTGNRPETAVFWAEVILRHQISAQTSLAGRHTNYGLLMINLSYPAGDGNTTLYTLAQEVTDGLRGKHTAGGVWFRSVSPREVVAEGPWQRFTITAEFEYDQI